MNTLNVITATEARKDWSQVIDNAVRIRPQIIKRTRDYVYLISQDMILDALSDVEFTAEEISEEDGSITVSLNEIDLMENGFTIEEAHYKLAGAILEYAEQFYEEFSYWSSAPNRKKHIPHVLRALILNDIDKIGEEIKWQPGKN